MFAILLVPSSVWAGKQPNVVFVLTDDQGYGDLGCHGNEVIKTPHIDRLYGESIRFTNFHVSPTCSQTRAQLLTGRYPTRTGVWHTIAGRSLLHKDEVTLADRFADSGYRTGLFGKWHLGDNYPFRPKDRGFQTVLTHGGGGIGNIQDYWDNDYFDDTYRHNGKWEKQAGYCTDIWFQRATQFIEKNKERPFFCYIATNAPHSPFLVPGKYERMYEGKNLDPEMARFYGMITNIDDQIGKLRAKLKEWDLDENTIFIYMTDNGSSRGWRASKGKYRFNAGMRGGKGSQYDGGHRVPFFVHYPNGGLTSGKKVDRLTAGIDLLPTLVELCQLKGNEKNVLDGVSLLPLLKDPKTKAWEERTLTVHLQRIIRPVKWRRTAVMTDRYRLVNETELYDMQSDIGQQKDISADHPELVLKLQGEYEKWWSSLQAAMSRDCEIVIGSRHENPTTLTTHDVLGVVAWNQDQVYAAARADGYWAIDVERDGLYQFTLRRWPKESNTAITGAAKIPEDLRSRYRVRKKNGLGRTYSRVSRTIKVTSARLKVGGFDEDKLVPLDAMSVSFQVRLKKGSTRLQAWFLDGTYPLGADVFGVYYVTAERIGLAGSLDDRTSGRK